MTILAIVGSRDFGAMEKVTAFVNSLTRDTVIVTGGARGVDRLAEISGLARNMKVIVFPADWTKHGRAAGPIRNKQVVDACDSVVAFWTGQVKNSGTHDVIVQAAKAGKGVRIITAISEAA